MPPETRRKTYVNDHFSLRQFLNVLEKVPPPSDAFSPHGAWKEAFAVYTCPMGHAGRVGTLSLVRTPQADGTVELHAVFDRDLGMGGRHVTESKIRYRDATFPSPVEGTVTCRDFDEQNAERKELRLDFRGEKRGTRVRLFAGNTSLRTFEVRDPACICRWLLFDAVRRFPREPGWRQGFTFLDRCDEPKPGHVVAYRFSTDLVLGATTRFRYVPDRRLEAGVIYRPEEERIGGRVVRMHTFEHVGTAMVPFVYWVDEAGRLLFAVSGLEAYVRQ